MTDITITIPLPLTASQIIRGSPAAISESEALELARELHDLIAEVQVRYVGRPLREGKLSDREAAFGLADLVDAMRRTVLGFWPSDPDAAGNESCWLMEELTDIDDALYDRYLRLHDRTQSTNFAEPLSAELLEELEQRLGDDGDDADALQDKVYPPLTH
jgi:hypothetical protein